MEDALRVFNRTLQEVDKVLILIVMEDALRAEQDRGELIITCVLILIVMEDALRGIKV